MKIENLNFSYNETPIFSNFNLDIECGKITTILGKSGVGKTTLLKCLAGIEKSNITPLNVSYVFQEDRLISHLTVFENLSIIGYNKVSILNGLQKLGLMDKANVYPSQLSGGEKKRVNILRAFLKDFDICLLDEPFSSLDISLKLELLRVLKDLQTIKGKTLLYITHDIEESLLISNRVIVLEKNTIKLDLTLDDTKNLRKYGDLSKKREQIINALL